MPPDRPPSSTSPEEVGRLERAALNAVPAPRVAWDGPFIIRAFLGGTGRANAACSLDPSPDPALDARITRIEAHYARLGLPTRFRCTPLDPPGLTTMLKSRGYARADGAMVMAGPLPAVPALQAEWLDAPSDDWLSVLATAEYQTAARRQEKAGSVALLPRPATWVLLRQGETPVAAGHAVADDGLLGCFDIATVPAARRQGWGRRILGALASWGARHAAERCWLQVAPGNLAARALYTELGLRDIYRYDYLLQH